MTISRLREPLPGLTQDRRELLAGDQQVNGAWLYFDTNSAGIINSVE
jgi:hypothetical protein